MTHSFLLAFCHLHIILHFFSRSCFYRFVLSSPSHLILLLFFLRRSLSSFSFSLFLSFHNLPLSFVSFTRLHLFSCVFFLVSICCSRSFCNIRRREEFHLRNTSATFVFFLGKKKKKCNFNPWLFQFQFVSAFCT